MKFNAKWSAALAFLTTSFAGVKEGDAVTEEHIEKMNADIAAHADTKAALTTAQDETTRLQSELTASQNKVAEHESTITSLNNQITGLNTKVAELGKVNPGATEPLKTGSDTTGAEAQSWEAEIANLPHNKAVDANPLFSGAKK